MLHQPLQAMTAILILTKNEEQIIVSLIDQLHLVLKNMPQLKYKLFLCDDSTDNTAQLARQKGVSVIKGGAKGLGWSYYLALYTLSFLDKFKNIITIDGDGQTDLSELPVFYNELNKGYDLIVGSRFLKKDLISYPYPKINFFGVQILSWIISLASGQKFTDSHGGLRAMRSQVAKQIKFLGTYSYVQESIITAKEAGFKVKELPSYWNKRKFGKSRVLHSKWKYFKKMSLPLLLRIKAYYIFLIPALYMAFFQFNELFVNLIKPEEIKLEKMNLWAGRTIFESFYPLIIAILLIFICEYYKKITYKKHKQKIKIEAGNG